MPSKQSEGIREGVEDHELLSMLREKSESMRLAGKDTSEVDAFLATAVTRALHENLQLRWGLACQDSRFDAIRVEALLLFSRISARPAYSR